jgi:hypothetical protein
MWSVSAIPVWRAPALEADRALELGDQFAAERIDVLG